MTNTENRIEYRTYDVQVTFRDGGKARINDVDIASIAIDGEGRHASLAMETVGNIYDLRILRFPLAIVAYWEAL